MKKNRDHRTSFNRLQFFGGPLDGLELRYREELAENLPLERFVVANATGDVDAVYNRDPMIVIGLGPDDSGQVVGGNVIWFRHAGQTTTADRIRKLDRWATALRRQFGQDRSKLLAEVRRAKFRELQAVMKAAAIEELAIELGIPAKEIRSAVAARRKEYR